MMKPLHILFLFALSFTTYTCSTGKNALQNVDPFRYTIQKKAEGTNGAVVSAHALASKVGVEVLKQGGNAVDAAIATHFALAVVYPGAGNLGGGGFMVARLANGETISLDFREMAPGAASRDMYLDREGNVVKGKSVNGHLASGVPGSVAGMMEAYKYAKLSFKKLIEPAIVLAEKGFAISNREARGLNALEDELKEFNTVRPVFIKDGDWVAGDTLIQTDLANTLKRIRDKGAAGFYEGETARLIVEEMKRGDGIITLEDLKNYKAVWRTPHRFTYKGHDIISMGMPSSGGVLINQMLSMVENRPLPSYGFSSVRAVQLMTEVERRAYADRSLHMGDADFYKVPVKTLTSKTYLEERMKDYDPSKAGSSMVTQPGIIAKESEETTHFSVIDKEGNAVAITTTLNDTYGSKTVVGGAGFLLNDEMDDFSLKAGVPNMYGALGGEANAIAPRKRMLSAMTPTIVLKEGKPFLILGTPGGTTIPTSVFQTIVNIIDFRMSTEDAVNKPKFHHQWMPDAIDLEKGFPDDVRKGLENLGYKINVRTAIGRTEVIKVLPGNIFEAVADRRGDDSAEAF